MKKLVSIVYLISLVLCTSAQERKFHDDIYAKPGDNNYNLSLVDARIIWQYVFDYPGDFSELSAHVSSSTSLRIISERDSTITLAILPFYNDYKSAGCGKFEVSGLIMSAKMSGNAIIQYKPGRYRVTVSDIEFDVKSNPLFAGCGGSIEFFALKGNKKSYISDTFLGKNGKVIDYNLKKKLNFNEKEINTDDDF